VGRERAFITLQSCSLAPIAKMRLVGYTFHHIPVTV
jgi:hypothetical protein